MSSLFSLHRFGRIIGLKGHNQMRKYIQRWASLVDRSKLHSESGVEIARLRNQLCNLKATLHDLTNQDEAAASLAAERALNRLVFLFYYALQDCYKQNYLPFAVLYFTITQGNCLQ